MNKEIETLPNIFIIESLAFVDEKKNRFEGNIIADILQLSGVPTEYYYVRTKREFKEVVRIFNESKYRYLHISCHGGDNAIWTTLDKITFGELGDIFTDIMKNKRLFLSACSVVNSNIAAAIIPPTGCYSIVGPEKDIFFGDATIMWSSFYHLMLRENSGYMLREDLLVSMQKVVNTFGEPMEYFSRSKHAKAGFKNTLIVPKP